MDIGSLKKTIDRNQSGGLELAFQNFLDCLQCSMLCLFPAYSWSASAPACSLNIFFSVSWYSACAKTILSWDMGLGSLGEF